MVVIKAKAFKKIKAYCKQMGDQEIGGLLTGKIKDGEIIVKDAIILKQEKSISSFKIDDKDLMDLTKNASPKFLASIIGWHHSHGNGSTFWSMVDDDCFERLARLCDMCFGIVVANKPRSKKINIRCRLDFFDRNGKYIIVDHIIPEINWLNSMKIDTRNIKGEIKQKVKDTKLGHHPVVNELNIYS